MVGGLKEQLEHRRVGLQAARAHLVQHRLEPMRETHQRLQPEGPGAALDRMHGTEADVARLGVIGAVLDRLQAVLQGFEQLLAFHEEGGADFGHGIGFGAHAACSYPATI